MEQIVNHRQLIQQAKHVLREGIQKANIDPSRSHMNYHPAGPKSVAEFPAALAEILTRNKVRVTRRDQVLFFGLVFSLPLNIGINFRVYFSECIDWAQRRYRCPLLSAHVHMDESVPHMHVYMVPVRDGRLSARDVLGWKRDSRAHYKSFMGDVAGPFGLQASGKERKEAQFAAVHSALHRIDDPALKSNIRDVILRQLADRPGPAYELLCHGRVDTSKHLRL